MIVRVARILLTITILMMKWKNIKTVCFPLFIGFLRILLMIRWQPKLNQGKKRSLYL